LVFSGFYFKDCEVYHIGRSEYLFFSMVACFRAVCCGDDHGLGRHLRWREEKVNDLATPVAVAHRARYNTRLRGEIHEEEEEIDEDSEELETFKNMLPLNKKPRCCDHIKDTLMECISKLSGKKDKNVA
jgi:hypothetical protein